MYKLRDQIMFQNIYAFQFEGNLMDPKGKWCIPDWAVRLYQLGYLYFEDEILYLDLGWKKIFVDLYDYIVMLETDMVVLDPLTFNTLFERKE